MKVSELKFNLLLAVFLTFGYNFIFFQKLWEKAPEFWFNFAFGLVVCALMIAFCNLLLFRFTAKPLAVTAVILNSFCLWFMIKYNLAVDKVVLLNVWESDFKEAKDLLTWSFGGFVLLTGIIPAAMILKCKIAYHQNLFRRFAVVAVAFMFCVAVIFPNYKNTAQFLRNNRALKYYLLPINYIGGVISACKIKLRKHHEIIKIGEDAVFEPQRQNDKKNLFVFIVGETARRANFSLAGYERATDKDLLEYGDNLLFYNNFTSCATSTAISVPCMFSNQNRSRFNPASASYTENVLDILQKSGYKVLWRDNNSGCKGVCKRVKSEDYDKLGQNDMILLDKLEEVIKQNNTDQWIFLHQQGSHGPAYYRHYPAEFGIFKPDCRNKNLSRCSKEEIINAYDNSLYFSNYMIARTIELLQKFAKDYNTALFYVSDHGESLGEKGIYLHAAPYIIAPKEQLEIPVVLWISSQTSEALGVDLECLQSHRKNAYSHDNIFHSILGLSGIKTAEYKPELDLFSYCRVEPKL